MNWKHFKLEEFTCKCGCGINEIDFDFVDRLDELRHAVGFPLIINSGYRCSEYNNKVSITGLSGPHVTGKAADLRIFGAKAHRLLMHVFRLNAFSGIGINQKGDYDSRFIHLDTLQHSQRPWIWSY